MAGFLNNLAILHKAIGEYEDAKLMHRRALAARKNALGAEHPDVAMSYELYPTLLEPDESAPETNLRDLARRLEHIPFGRLAAKTRTVVDDLAVDLA